MKGACYQCLYNGPGQYIVIKRWVDKQGRPHRFDYEVAYKKGRWMCDPKCKGFNMSKAECIHIKFAKICSETPALAMEADDFDWIKHLKYREE